MKKSKKILWIIIIALAVVIIGGALCGIGFLSKDDTADLSKGFLSSDELICEATVSPNEDYVAEEEERVVYEVKVYQKKDNTIIVTANSNSDFFDEMQYELEYDKTISKSDVSIVWTTLMGNQEVTEEDQIALANVSISSNGEVFSERTINFFEKGIEIIVETIDQSK